ncbi:S41 family peptidase [uncultured Mucilaginibacter sp.]|uniref:S41 family peptidase n=1 Tax=uncultured Mucilaginibacter sp. TaxID=797541 RepID=UPI0025FE92D6|nr:S41 family peptidase [uncultured Mucilaginibacter sp.]
MKKIFYAALIISVSLIAACKKSSNTKTNTNPTEPSKVGTTLQLIQDSVWLYAKEDYLWFDQLPSYANFGPRTFTDPDALTALTKELDALSQYAINPATSAPYEKSLYSAGTAKYSFIDDGSESAALNGVKGDFGFDVQYNQWNDLRVEFAYAGSPAGIAGIHRGDMITSINGSTKITYDSGTYGDGSGTNLNFVSNAIYNSKTITLGLTRTNGTTYTASLNTGNYNVNPVLKDTVVTDSAGHKVGYIVFNSFVSDAVADPLLNAAFANFATAGISDLVVDLRYNGGGYVSTAEHIDNLIVPAAKTGSLMYNTYYNSNLVAGNDPLLHNQWRSGTPDYNYAQFSYTVADNAVNFAKVGSLNVNRVFFIITGQTASASELTINNLRPEMDVQFIGEQSYGKPVGFFDIDINKYIMFTPEFSVQNSAGQGGYYQGFTPGNGYPGVNDYDDLTKDWGDPTEGLLADVLRYTYKATYVKPKAAVKTNGLGQISFAAAIPKRNLPNKHKFTGMIGKKTSLLNILKKNR